MIPLVICIVLGIIYWCIEEEITNYKFHTNITVVIKWSSVIGLIAEVLRMHYHEVYDKLTNIIHKSIIFVLYAIGDVVISFNQNYSIGFFIGGHILLLSKYIIKLMIMSIEYTIITIAATSIITILSSYAFRRSSDMDNNTFIIYVVYIFVLAQILITPIIVSGYIGHVFFVISDVLIGFKIKQLSKLTFPLYYSSLICLLYLYNLHD